MIKPKRLLPGDRVALVSLSSGIAGEDAFYPRFDLGRNRLKEAFGLEPVVMPHTLKGIDYLDRHPEARAEDLMAAFADDSIKGIISCIGGDDTIRLLPYIDFDLIRANPKIFMGYSDTTINHFMLYKAGVSSFYGPSILGELAENGMIHEYTKDHIKKVLMADEYPLEVKSSPEWTSEYLEWVPENAHKKRKMNREARCHELLQGKGRIQGRLLGGCIDVFPMAVGTPIWPEPDQWQDALLFIETSEDCPRPEEVKYILRGLAAQGIFERIKGILVGKPRDEQYYEEYKQVLLQVVGREAGRVDLPILYNMNFGHTAPMCVLPYGAMAEINCGNAGFTLLESPVI